MNIKCNSKSVSSGLLGGVAPDAFRYMRLELQKYQDLKIGICKMLNKDIDKESYEKMEQFVKQVSTDGKRVDFGMDLLEGVEMMTDETEPGK